MAVELGGIGSYLNTDASIRNDSAAASKVSGKITGVGSDSSDEELTEAVESFESYMLEQVIKKMKDTIKMDGDEDDSNSQLTDYYMDSTISNLASTMVKEYGGNLTEQLVAQMKRNYGMSNEQQLVNNVNTDTENVTPEQASAAASGSTLEDE